MNKLLSSFVIGSAVAMTGSPLSAQADQIPMNNPTWGYVLSELGSKGLDTAYVFTNTTATMSWTAPDGVQSVELLVVGGGGAGGNGKKSPYGLGGGGGGGAGGYRYFESRTVVPGTAYEIKVGAGAIPTSDASNGADSTFDDVCADGGGNGGCWTVGQQGGSGGGGSYATYKSSKYVDNAGGLSWDAAEGNNGGAGTCYGGNYGTGGGGGGAGGAGGNASVGDVGGNGGPGVECWITGERVVYASGGGGATSGDDSGLGGEGAGNGGINGGAEATDAIGYGCGGGGGCQTGNLGGKGFQGIVVVRVNVREKEVVSMDDPTWGYKILGLDSTGHEIVYVFTNTTAQMSWTAPVGTTTAELLVVGGGGAGGGKVSGYSIGGGGGGAGGYVHKDAYSVVANQDYLISVGAGAKSAADKVGGDSTFGAVIAKGGGCGGAKAEGQNGGCGGGGSGKKSSATKYAGGTGSSGQGFAGGSGEGYWKGDHVDAGTGGGGGGAETKGGSAPNDEQGGIGGAGKTCAITGESVVYCSGGGGGTDSGVRTYNDELGCYNGIGGVGAGDGGDKNCLVGGDATGYGCGGGGAAGDRSGNTAGGAGFQGVVIVRVYEHEWDWNDVVFSTCTESGHSNAVCTIEGCTETAHLDIAPLGHDFSGLPYAHGCTRDECEVNAAVFPTLDPVVYTGEAQKPDLADEFFDVDYGVETYVDAKTYTIKLTPKANTVWSDTQSAAARNVSYTITQAENEWTDDPSVSPDYWKVTAVPDEITIVNGSAVFGTVVCDKTVEDLKKLAAGTHQVNFTVAETANWAGLTKSVAIEIAAGIALDGTLNANSRTVSLNLGASSKPLALVLAYGATDEGGKLWDGWDSQMVLKKIAGGSGASQYTYKMPLEGLGDGVKYIRFFLVADQEPIDNAEIEGMSATFDFIPHVHDWSSYVDADGYRQFKCSDPDCTEVKRDKLDYTHLWSYLESDGKGYIKTDYVPNMDKTRVDVIYRHLDNGHFCLFEANSTSAKDKYADEDDGMMLVYWGVDPSKPTEVPSFTFYNYDLPGATFKYMPNSGAKHKASVFQHTLTLDGKTSQMSGGSYCNVQGPMVFFRHIAAWDNQKRTIITYSHGSMYSVKIYETENNVETLIHDYVPATKDGQNAGFWDRVENKYWPSTSAGFRARTNGLSITIR